MAKWWVAALTTALRKRREYARGYMQQHPEYRDKKNAEVRSKRAEKTAREYAEDLQRLSALPPEIWKVLLAWRLSVLEAKRHRACEHVAQLFQRDPEKKRLRDRLAGRKEYQPNEIEKAIRAVLDWGAPNPIRRQSVEREKARQVGKQNDDLADNLRERIRCAVRGIATKSAPTMVLIGCSIQELRAHLEALFLPGMTWKNYGFRGWHVDHKRPCVSFDLTDPAQQRACFHYTNLQPLWAKDNLKKHAKWAPVSLVSGG